MTLYKISIFCQNMCTYFRSSVTGRWLQDAFSSHIPHFWGLAGAKMLQQRGQKIKSGAQLDYVLHMVTFCRNECFWSRKTKEKRFCGTKKGPNALTKK